MITAISRPAKAEGRIWGRTTKKGQPGDAKQMSDDHSVSVSDFIGKPGGGQINKNLSCKINQDQAADLLQSDSEPSLKDRKQQGRQIIDNGLGHISAVTGDPGMTIG